ncbi:acyltransferase family protein [Corynebacterium sp. HMSC072G08]|uniref:acyltransferase family protein n=1 Tax=Corynebacterium sp. HMSC072G08 TaxID=1715039 RepID=UPI000AF9986F|nr:acyltransferase family protein [Corynebacterium sp. HMSC072G08]
MKRFLRSIVDRVTGTRRDNELPAPQSPESAPVSRPAVPEPIARPPRHAAPAPREATPANRVAARRLPASLRPAPATHEEPELSPTARRAHRRLATLLTVPAATLAPVPAPAAPRPLRPAPPLEREATPANRVAARRLPASLRPAPATDDEPEPSPAARRALRRLSGILASPAPRVETLAPQPVADKPAAETAGALAAAAAAAATATAGPMARKRAMPVVIPSAAQRSAARAAEAEAAVGDGGIGKRALATPVESAAVRKNARARLRLVPGLDGLRGLAVLAVVIYHFFGDVLPGGYLGVDMFFVLSGFLITSLLVREFRVTGRISLKDFWVRRFRRILPAAVTVLVICTAIVAAIGGDLAVGIREQFLGTLFFVNNWTQIATSQSYFADNEIQVFAHYWSLAVEEQFYLIWPLLIAGLFIVVRRYPRRVPIIVSVVLAAASAVAMWFIYTPGEDPTRVYYGTDTHAFGLLIGAALSLIITSTHSDPAADSWPSSRRAGAIAAQVLAPLALLAYLAQLIFMTDDLEFTYRGGLMLTSVLGALMLWGVVRDARPLTWLFSTTVMRWLGQRSFSLYLWHWPLIMILIALFDSKREHAWVWGLVALPLSFLLAEISYQFIENPFRRGGYKKAWTTYWASRPGLAELRYGFAKVAWPLVPLLVVASLAGVVYGVVTSSDKTQLERDLEELQQLNNSGSTPAPEAAAPTTTAKKTRPMPRGPEITAIGDSVMLASSAALNTRFPGLYIDAAVSRHYTAAIPIVQELKSTGQLRDTVFLGFGTNGAAFPGQLDELIDAIGPDRTIVLSVPYGDRDWMPGARAEVIQAAKDHKNVYIADWCTHAQSNTSLLRADGVHPEIEGADQYALAFQYALQQYSNYDKNTSTQCAV